jgi:hypothetical protein
MMRAANLSKACVWKSESWGHDGEQRTREGAVKQLIKTLRHLIAKAELVPSDEFGF